MLPDDPLGVLGPCLSWSGSKWGSMLGSICLNTRTVQLKNIQTPAANELWKTIKSQANTYGISRRGRPRPGFGQIVHMVENGSPSKWESLNQRPQQEESTSRCLLLPLRYLIMAQSSQRPASLSARGPRVRLQKPHAWVCLPAYLSGTGSGVVASVRAY